MIIPAGFDESNKERKRRIFNKHIETSEKLKRRVKHFFKNVDQNHSLTNGEKNIIKKIITENL